MGPGPYQMSNSDYPRVKTTPHRQTKPQQTFRLPSVDRSEFFTCSTALRQQEVGRYLVRNKG